MPSYYQGLKFTKKIYLRASISVCLSPTFNVPQYLYSVLVMSMNFSFLSSHYIQLERRILIALLLKTKIQLVSFYAWYVWQPSIYGFHMEDS